MRNILRLPRAALTCRQIRSHLGKLIECRLQILHDLGGKDGWVGEIGRVAEAVISEPEDVEVGFVPLQKVLIREAMEALRFGTLVTVGGIVAADEVVEVGAG